MIKTLTIVLLLSCLSFAQMYERLNVQVIRANDRTLLFNYKGDLSNDTLQFVVKATRSITSPRLVQKISTNESQLKVNYYAGVSLIEVYLQAEDTEDRDTTRHWYDITRVNNGDTSTLFLGWFDIWSNVATRFDGTNLATDGSRFYVAGTFIDSTVADGSVFVWDSTAQTLSAISKDSLWSFLQLTDSVNNKIDSVFLGYEDTTIYIVNDSAGIDLAITNAIEAEKQYPNGLIALDLLYKIMTTDIIFEDYQKDYIAQSVDTLQVDVLANASHINALADSLRDEMTDQDTIDVTVLNATKILQTQRTGFNGASPNSLNSVKLESGISQNINLRWSENSSYFTDSLKYLNAKPSNNFKYLDSIQSFVPRNNSAYNLDGWKYAYGYNKKGGVTIRIDWARSEGEAERVIALFEKYGARAWYVVYPSQMTYGSAAFYREILYRGHEIHTHSFGYVPGTIDSAVSITTVTSLDGEVSFSINSSGTDSVYNLEKKYYNLVGLPPAGYTDNNSGGISGNFYPYQDSLGYYAQQNQYEASKSAEPFAGGVLAYGNPINTRYGLGTSWDGDFEEIEAHVTGFARTHIKKIADGVAKHYVVGDHIHDVNMWVADMEMLDSVLAFCFENKILVTGITDWVHICFDMPTNPYINIAPQFWIDLDNDGVSDGWELKGGLTTSDFYNDDGYEGDYAWQLDASSSDVLACGIIGDKLYGWELGTNTIGLAVKGISDYDSVYVVIEGTDKDGVFSDTLRYAVTANWTVTTQDFYNTFSSNTTATGRGRTVEIIPKNGIIRISAPIIKKKW